MSGTGHLSGAKRPLVIEVFSRATLDIIGIFGLGVDLKNLSSENSIFHECYHDVFEPGPAGMVLTAINAFVPIRWLPVKPNRDFMRANGIVRSILGDVIKQRIEKVRIAKERSSPGHRVAEEQESKDLLTFMVEEKYFGYDDDRWTEEDMLNQILNFVAGGECCSHFEGWKVGTRTANLKQGMRRRRAPLSGRPTSYPHIQMSRGVCSPK